MPPNDSSLKTIMNMGIPPNKVLLYFSKLLDGVEAAHLKNVIHRGSKPETIIYDSKSDTALIADFGVAHFNPRRRPPRQFPIRHASEKNWRLIGTNYQTIRNVAPDDE